MDSLPASREIAKRFGSINYYTGKPCRNGHISIRMTSWGTCLACHREKEARRRDAKIEELKQYRAREDVRQRNSRNNKRWREEKAEELNAKRIKYQRENRGRVNANTALYFCRKKRAAPPWVDKAELRRIYANCPQGFHVDHIVPLKHDLICGLHVPWNLQYLSKSENSRKRNRQTLEQLQGLAVVEPNLWWVDL